MLKDRLQTSAILIAVVALLLYLDGNFSVQGSEGLWLIPLLLFFALGTAWDISGLLMASGRKIARPDALLGTAIVTLSATVPLFWPLWGSVYPVDCPVGRVGWVVVGGVVAVFVILIAEMSRYGKTAARAPQRESEDHDVGENGAVTSGAIERICAAVFVSVYVGLPMALLVVIRSAGTGNWGLAALLTTIAVTKSADAGAYFSGRALGKRKLVPRLSPGKTREGAIGGIATATIVAFACLCWLFPAIAGGDSGPAEASSLPGLDRPFWGALLLGPLLAVSGMVGDLAESLVKRDAGAKDSGNLLPGLGGVWDVTDSLVAAVMPAFLCFAAGVGS